ncbi:DNA-methyltransferase [Tautonia marina]|uniref:DNA-methyltransferase n=1 Tax=Tautonia marina TaxID=2653855 RepID=UPI001260EDAB|nr:site-specific DNA-methyltransferase [Tautonia marina]
MTITILTGCCLSLLATLPDQSVHTCVTSPPYWGLRDYGITGQFGLEQTPAEFIQHMVRVFRDVRRVLRDNGTLWLNIGDSYAGHSGGNQGKNGWRSDRTFTARVADKFGSGLKPKDLVGIPWRLAFALQDDGWFLRSDIIWSKPNPMPESVTDRPTKSHEYLFLLTKSERYYYDREAIAEPCRWNPGDTKMPDGWDTGPGAHGRYHRAGREQGVRIKRSGNKERKSGSARGCPEGTGANVCGSVPWEGTTRNKRSVWTVATKPFSDAHFATYPPELIEPCVLAGSPIGGTVLDPFFGAGTTGLVADRHGRHCIGIELNPDYVQIAERRLRKDAGMFADIVVAA